MNRRVKIIRVAMLFWVCALASAASARAGEFQTTRDVVYVERGDSQLKADVYLPNEPGPLPAVLLVHGGAWRQGNKSHMTLYANKLAAAGFTCVSIAYRLAPEHPFPAQIEDCKTAVRWMRANAAKFKIDPARIGALGYSAGGHLVALLATTDPSSKLEGPDADGTSTKVACVVAGGAPCDFRLIPPNVKGMAYWLGGTRAEKPEVYEQASPAKFVTPDDPPTLFFHGDADRLVPLGGVRRMQSALDAAGVTAELYLVQGAGHVEAFLNPTAVGESVKFLEKHLKTSPAAPR